MDVYVRMKRVAVARTIEHAELDGVVVDYAEDGSVVGFEVLGAAGVDFDGVWVEGIGPYAG